ncbi:MAG: FAD-dependent oxidoreductase [Planctomycetaceae bacterium]|nr:FAD-dependent oxidoreductase [Planctomycetaceae bacterium]
MKTWKIGIIGAGPGGLFTAYSLQRMLNAPIAVTIFEATNRVGGKILTPQFNTGKLYYEAGAAEFYDYSGFQEDPLKELIEEMGLPICEMGGPSVFLDQNLIANLDDLERHYGAAARYEMQRFDRFARDFMTPQEYYNADYPEGWLGKPDRNRFQQIMNKVQNPNLKRYLQTLLHSDLATEPERTSRTYGLQNYLMNDAAYMRLYGIEGGNERLPRELAKRIQATFCMNTPVTSISRTPEGQLEITSIHENQEQSQEFDYVVVALPHNHLRSVNYCGDLLSQAVDRHYDHYCHPAHYLRMTLLFEKAFWKPLLKDSFWMLDEFEGCCLYDESSRIPGCQYGVLGWLLGGNVAQQLCTKSDPELIQLALDSLPQCLRQHQLPCLEGKVHRWEAAVNAMPGGEVPQSLDRRHQPEPHQHPTLFFVGDYLFDSTLNGVIDSAEYVVSWIASEIHAPQKIVVPKQFPNSSPATNPSEESDVKVACDLSESPVS